MKYKSNSSLDSISELSESEISYLSSGNLCNQHQLTDGIPLDCICTDKTKCTSSTQTCAKLWDSVIKKRLSHSIDFMREISCRSLMNAPYLSPGKLNNGMPSSCLLRKYQSPNKLYRIRKRLQSKENIKSNRFVNRNDTEHTHRNLKLYTKPNTYTYLSNYGNVLSDSDESLSFEGMKHLVPISTIPSPYIPCDEETYLLNIQSNAKQNDGQLGRNIPRVKSEELLIIQCDKLAENLSVNCMCNRSELPNSLGVSQHGNFISLNENLKTNCHRGSKKLDGGSNFSKNGKTQPSLYVGEKDRNCSKILQKYQLKPVKNTSTKKTPLTKSPTDALERSELTNVHTYNAYVKCKSSNGLKKKEKIGVKKCSASKNLIHPSSTPSHHRQHHHYHSLACQPKPSNSTYSHPADKQKQRRDVEKKSSNTRHGQLSSHEHRVSLSRDKKRHHSLPPGKQKRHNTAFLTKKQILDASKHVSPDVYVMLGAENRYSLISHYIRHSQEHLSPDLPAVSSALVPVINRNYPTTTTTNSLHHNLNKPVKLKQGCVQYSLEQQTNIDSFDNDDISILTILPIIVVKYSLQTFMDNWIGDKNALHCNFSELFQSNLIWMMIRCEKVINQSHVYQLITSMCLNNSLIMQIPLECLDHYKIFSNIEKLDSDTPLKGIKKNEGDNAPLRPPSTMTNTPLTTKTAFEQHSCGLSSSSSTSCNRVHTLCHKHPVSFCKKIANFLFCYCGNFSSGSSVSYTHYNSDLSLYDSSNDFINNSKSDFIYLLVNE
ncbi:unnamed protein product [Trichobilharzia regenti]|nr:unnamed protein product [Trichobilharzia regenti]